MPKLKQYTEEEGAALLDNSGAGSEGSDDERDLGEVFAHQIRPILSKIRSTAEAIDIDGYTKVKYEGKKYNWPTIRVMSKDRAHDGRSLVELTMHPSSLRIARMVWANVTYEGDQKLLIRMIVDFDRISIGEPLPESAFVFTPPKKAKLVDAVPIPGQTGSYLLNQPRRTFH